MNPMPKLQLQTSITTEIDFEEKPEGRVAEVYFEFEPETKQLTDAEILEDTFVDDYDEFTNTELLGEDFDFIPDGN